MNDALKHFGYDDYPEGHHGIWANDETLPEKLAAIPEVLNQFFKGKTRIIFNYDTDFPQAVIQVLPEQKGGSMVRLNNGNLEVIIDAARVRAAKEKLSTPEVQRTFGDALKECGRVPVAICVAATIIKRRDRLRAQTVRWAEAVLKLWTKNPDSAYIDDNLHPTRIEEYAGAFMRLTTEEA